MCDMTLSKWHDLFIWVSSLRLLNHPFHAWSCGGGGMTHSCVRHDSLVCETWLIHMCDMTHSYVWHDTFICETCLIHICDMTYSYVWHASFICVTWLNHMCDMTHSYVWHDSFIYVTWHIHVSVELATIKSPVSYLILPDSYMCHDTFMCMRHRKGLRDVYETHKGP